MRKLHVALGIVVASSVFALAACGGSQQSAEPPATPEPAAVPPEPAPAAETPPATSESAPAAEPSPEPKTIEVALQAKSNSKLAGKATFTETSEGVKVVLAVENVKPGDHGTHIHEKGDCSTADGSSAGGHYNPGSHPHALPTGADAPRHLGDLGNITVGKDGKGTLEIVAPGANLKDGDPNSFVGRAIIVHEKKDDGGQPVGNAGGRIGCAEIK